MQPQTKQVDETTAVLVAACREAGAVITPDGRVSERVAGELLGYAEGSLRAMRNVGNAPAWYHLPAGEGSRVSYRLRDIAEWIERRRNDCALT